MTLLEAIAVYAMPEEEFSYFSGKYPNLVKDAETCVIDAEASSRRNRRSYGGTLQENLVQLSPANVDRWRSCHSMQCDCAECT